MKEVTQEIIAFIILFAPTAWEYRDDRKGDFNKKKDVIFRSCIAAVTVLINFWLTDRMILKSAFMCFAMFFLVFDYWIASVFAPQGKWFSYMGEKGWFDNIGFWKGLNPWVRFLIRLAVFAGALIYYF